MPTKKTTKATKKTVAKKTVKPAKATTKTIKPATPEIETHTCNCGNSCACGCHHHCGAFKKIVVMIIVFCLGYATAHFFPCKKYHKHMMPKLTPVYVNGCLDMDSIKCPKAQKALANADENADGCISEAEYKVSIETLRNARKHKNK